jgi:hypothetical protein
MSNYISRLIARSFNQIETIQPRLPAIFEPHINDALDSHKREVDIDPTNHSSKENEFISALSDSNKQISSNPVKKKIKTGINDLELQTSSRLQSYKSKDLTNINETNPEMSHESLNFINPDSEYPEEVGDTIIDEFISTLSDSNKQISSNPVKKKIKTGINDLDLQTSSRLQSKKSKDLTNTNETNLEMSHEPLNFINRNTEYPEEVGDTIIDENVSHDIFFKPDNNQTQNTDLLGSPNFINQLNASRHTLLEQNVSTSEQVSAGQSDSQILKKLNDQPDSSNATGDEINYIQQRNEVESNSVSYDNSNIEKYIQPVIINQTRSNKKNVLLESIPQKSSFHPFKGKLVEKSRMKRNDNSPTEINDPSQQSVIRVNIGRIEVRAVQPPTPPPQPQGKQFKPILSLDDYLSQRNGG